MLFDEEQLLQADEQTQDQLLQLKSEVETAKQESAQERKKIASLEESLEMSLSENEKLRRQIEIITQLRQQNKLRQCDSIGELQSD